MKMRENNFYSNITKNTRDDTWWTKNRKIVQQLSPSPLSLASQNCTVLGDFCPLCSVAINNNLIECFIKSDRYCLGIDILLYVCICILSLVL